jgi:hypothetical protein
MAQNGEKWHGNRRAKAINGVMAWPSESGVISMAAKWRLYHQHRKSMAYLAKIINGVIIAKRKDNRNEASKSENMINENGVSAERETIGEENEEAKAAK